VARASEDVKKFLKRQKHFTQRRKVAERAKKTWGLHLAAFASLRLCLVSFFHTFSRPCPGMDRACPFTPFRASSEPAEGMPLPHVGAPPSLRLGQQVAPDIDDGMTSADHLVARPKSQVRALLFCGPILLCAALARRAATKGRVLRFCRERMMPRTQFEPETVTKTEEIARRKTTGLCIMQKTQ
jgi:hypothetical protein